MSEPASCGAHCSTAVAALRDGRYRRIMYRWLVLAVLLSGCASAFPKEVMSTVNTAVTVEMLRPDPVAFKGQRVMVGGDILSTQPRTDETEIELLARRLGSDGAPDRGDQAPGRPAPPPPWPPAPAGHPPGGT